MASVSLRGVGKRYVGAAKEPVAAVRGVDLEIRDGEFVVLVGPSGCGKTTTLRMIAGLEEISEGEIKIGDRVVNQVSPRDRNIAMVFQNYALYPHMNVYRNMAFSLELRYRSDWLSRAWLAVSQPQLAKELADKRRGIPERVQQTAEMLGIERLLSRKPGELSGGEKQRVALGRAIVRQPAAFLFDEPLSNLDAQLRGEMRRELRRLHTELKTTMIYVTHDQVEAMTLGDRIVVMQGGEVRQVGTPLEVYDRPADTFVAQFLGSPPMNLIEGKLKSSKQSWSFVSETTNFELPVSRDAQRIASDELVEGRKLTLGVRPEDAQFSNEGRGEFQANVEMVESLGDSTLVHVKMGKSSRFAVKLRDRVVPTVGDQVAMRFDPERIHWFDAETGKRIGERRSVSAT